MSHYYVSSEIWNYRTNNIDDHVCVYVCLSLSHVQLFATPQTTRGQMKIHYNKIYPKL